jgi:hypothetical protein
MVLETIMLKEKLKKEEIRFQIWPIWPFKGLGFRLCPLPPLSPNLHALGFS